MVDGDVEEEEATGLVAARVLPAGAVPGDAPGDAEAPPEAAAVPATGEAEVPEEEAGDVEVPEDEAGDSGDSRVVPGDAAVPNEEVGDAKVPDKGLGDDGTRDGDVTVPGLCVEVEA